MAPEEEFLALRDIFYADLGGECAPRFYLRLLRCDNCNLRAFASSPFFFCSYSLSGGIVVNSQMVRDRKQISNRAGGREVVMLSHDV